MCMPKQVDKLVQRMEEDLTYQRHGQRENTLKMLLQAAATSMKVQVGRLRKY